MGIDFVTDPLALTPVSRVIEPRWAVWLKRDDAFMMEGIRGGKVRACWHLATRDYDDGGGLLPARRLPPARGLITASARKSPQAQIVARLAHKLGIPARCHMPEGQATEEMEDMVAHGGTLVQHKAGYNNVIIARALADYAKLSKDGWRYIPFGMEHRAAMECTADQAQSIFDMMYQARVKPSRIVICIGSGMSAAAVLHGLKRRKLAIPVLGIRIGADPTRRLDRFAPDDWRKNLTVHDITGEVPYETAVDASVGGVKLDPHYEAKCVPFLRTDDLLWVVGIRATAETQA
jgi:1-aminocyclopropane-1-carboxylate deaminase/D-cysteine desulfhydrase-like pyridoxal-dependent ACC family enzyme